MQDLTNTVLLAQGPDAEGWFDLLFIVIVAVFWIGGAIVKGMQARKGARQQQRRDGPAGKQRRPTESWQERLARKAEEMQRAAEAKGRRVAERAKRTQEELAGRPLREPGPHPPGPQPAGGQLTVRQGAGGESVMVYERPQSQPAAADQADRQRRAHQAVPSRQQRPARRQPAEPRAQSVRPPTEPLIEGLPTPTPEPPTPLGLGREHRVPVRPTTGALRIGSLDLADPEGLRKAILHYEILGKPVALRGAQESGAGF